MNCLQSEEDFRVQECGVACGIGRIAWILQGFLQRVYDDIEVGAKAVSIRNFDRAYDERDAPTAAPPPPRDALRVALP